MRTLGQIKNKKNRSVIWSGFIVLSVNTPSIMRYITIAEDPPLTTQYQILGNGRDY